MNRITVFRASPRKNGNTNALTDVVVTRFRSRGCNVTEFSLYDMDIRPCIACRQCQRDWETVTCVQQDDMHQMIGAICESDLLILATPVYSWYCTPPMKAMLDRLVYMMNMYYGGERGPSLWKGKQLALITTCGYPPEKGADLLEEGIRRYCKHSQLSYEGMLCGRHMGYDTQFMDDDKHAQAIAFADGLCSYLTSGC
ncbi:MAG: flavodoxin family protein [Firmicutes bacterium]|nr:flavodoxin family protein [Bacillota bacterium]